jgi:murein L,D-transpeptidase YcbB/YkuD
MRLARSVSSAFSARGVLLAAALLVTACGDASQSPAVHEGSAAPAPSEDERVAAARTALEDDVEAAYAAWFTAQVASQPLKAALVGETLASKLEREAFLAARYATRDWKPAFVELGQLNPVGQAIVDALRLAPDHVLDTSHYHLADIERATNAAREWQAGFGAAPPPALGRDERTALIALLDRPDVHAASNVLDAAFTALLGDAAASPRPELAAAHQARLRLARGAAGSAAELEALLADGILAYAYDQRHFNVSGLDDPKDPAGRAALIDSRLTSTFAALTGATDAAAAATVLGALPPDLPQYPLLVGARKRYLDMVANGGWQPITAFEARRGATGPRIQQLKQRLATEGYFSGTVDDRFDDALADAIETYQTSHQLDPRRGLGRDFWTSINVPAEQRLRQIEITIQRWRESRIRDDKYYALVNIPDFHAEIWRNGHRDMRFKIVVGNTERKCDPETQTMKYPNATPTQSARMTYVTLNPYWNVPLRILQEELLPDLLESDDYFERQGIERATLPDGAKVVRQKPGPQNPLGKVKFMFPNPHNTYMHDTNKRNYFDYTVRAFSHGCMRVHNPLDLLEYILTQDGQWDEARIDRMFEREEETSITLKTPLPVHMEYYVVRVDDDGVVHFLSDIYKYDRDRMSPPSAESLRCRPEAEPEFELTLSPENKVMFKDKEGNVVDPKSLRAPEPEDDSPAAGDLGP